MAAPQRELGVGVGQEEERVPNDAETESASGPGPLADGGDTSPAVLSSASESRAVRTRRDLRRVTPRLVNISEHLRQKLHNTKKAFEAVTEERKQEAPTLQKHL